MGRRHLPACKKGDWGNQAGDLTAVRVGEELESLLVVEALGDGSVDDDIGIEQNSHRGNCALEAENRVGKSENRGTS
jgi:hypothetical protein